MNYDCGPVPNTGSAGNQYYIEYTLSSVTTMYSPSPIGWAFMIGGLFALAAPPIAETMGVSEEALTLINALDIGVSSALTVVGAFVNTALVNQNTFGLSANVYINLPSPYTQVYITLVGSLKVTSTSGSQSLYPAGMIINYTYYYSMGEEDYNVIRKIMIMMIINNHTQMHSTQYKLNIKVSALVHEAKIKKGARDY